MRTVAFTGSRKMFHSDGEVRQMVMNKLRYGNIDRLIVGMADGADLCAGQAAKNLGIELWCAVPFKGHKTNKDECKTIYDDLIEYATRVEYLADSNYGPDVYHSRNRWMVDHADFVLAYLDPSLEKGGTLETVKYANGKKPIYNIWDDPPF